MRSRSCGLVVLLAAAVAVATPASARTPLTNGLASARPTANVKHVRFGDTRLAISFVPTEFKLTEQDFIDWALRSARATATFFGRFPVRELRISIAAVGGDDVGGAIATADPKALIRIGVGRNTSARRLEADSTLVHEMAHLGFPDMDEVHLWLHEGIATYVETIARAQSREIGPAAAWAHFADILPHGLPESGDGGLYDTPSENRRYWGGAAFCLVADIEIRRRTNNRYGLKDALRAVLAAGGTLDKMWEVERAIEIADRAVGVAVLRELFPAWKDRSVAPDLDHLWTQLGVRKSDGGQVRLVDAAPLAAIRRAITEPPARPLLFAGPSLLYEATRTSPAAAAGDEAAPATARQ
jgi:hypothetical protein